MSFFADNALAIFLFVLGALCSAGFLAVRASRREWSLGWLFLFGMCVFGGAGALRFTPATVGSFIALGCLGVLLIKTIVVASSGAWWAPLGFLAGFGLSFGFFAWQGDAIQRGLAVAGLFAASLEPLQPYWLAILLVIPVLAWYSFKSLAGLGTSRRIIVLTCRSLLIALIALALAETHARRPDRNLTVLFLWDRSLSMPVDFQGDVDQVQERIKRFINDAVKLRGAGRDDDKVGVIVFGKRPRLELPPSAVPELNLRKVLSVIDDTYTDIAGAMKLALASFPEGTSKRIVLVTDGSENLGDAEEQARLAKQNGVQVDIVPIAARKRTPNEVLVERIEAPTQVEKDARVPLRIVVQSFHPAVVAGDLQLSKIALEMKQVDGVGQPQPFFESRPVASSRVKLKQGLNVFYFQQPTSARDDAHTYEAKFSPRHVESLAGTKIQDGLPEDRVENNRASVNVMARGQRSALIVEPEAGMHQLLVDRLQKARSSMKIVAVEPGRLPQDPAQLALILSKFDCVVLANLPAETLSEEQQKAIRSNTHDQGCGLVMIGGPQSFGAGGWHNTEIEKALPVTMDLKSMKIESKGGLVLMMHASEMAEGNAWQRKIARLAIERLSPVDMIGMIYYDHGAKGGGHRWHIPFQQIKNNRTTLLRLVGEMEPGDMPDVDPQFEMAYKELTNANYELGTRHIIFISDGDHWNASNAVLTKLRNAKITCTTVCITTHGRDEVKKMATVARATGGRSYHITDPSELPAIYIKESRLVSQSFVHEKPFPPRLLQRSGPTEGLPGDLPNLFGFVRTTRRPSNLVEVPIETPKIGDYSFPVLAHWQYGLGKSAAFTSDARTQPGVAGKVFWDRDWANSELYARFWEQCLDWTLRPTESGQHLQVQTEQASGKIRVIVEARDLDKTPITAAKLKMRVSSPSFAESGPRQKEVEFEQVNSGVYQADLNADEVGAYFINVQAAWEKDGKKFFDSVRTGASIPYSPEFAELEANTALLERVRDVTGGNAYSEAELPDVARTGVVYRPVPFSHSSLHTLWPWLVFIAALCLLVDVAARRIAIEPEVAWAGAVAAWTKLRGNVNKETPADEFIERLKSRKAETNTQSDREKSQRRFEADSSQPPAPGKPVLIDGKQATSDKPGNAKSEKPADTPKKQAPDDAMTRLLKAKKKTWEERDKDK